MGSFGFGLVILEDSKDTPGVAARILGNEFFFISYYKYGLEIFVKTPPPFVYYLLLKRFLKRSRGSK